MQNGVNRILKALALLRLPVAKTKIILNVAILSWGHERDATAGALRVSAADAADITQRWRHSNPSAENTSPLGRSQRLLRSNFAGRCAVPW